jgi:hypothetical protein
VSISHYRASAGLLLSLVLLLAACGEDEGVTAPPPAPESLLGVVPAEMQRPGNPEAGYAALVNEPYVSCGMPYAAYRQTASPPPPSQLLPGRKGRNAELPYMLNSYVTKSGVELVTYNCLGCHAGFFNDQLVIGLGNESLDFTEDPAVPAESLGAYVTGEAAAAEWRKWADRVAAMAPYMITDTVGVNPANNLTLALIAHRDPKTLAWSRQPLLEPPPKKPLPVSVPPWWRMKKKHAMFHTASGRGDHAQIMMTASILCTDTVEEARAIDAYAPDVRAFIASLEPPTYPFAVDRTLADRGRAVFEGHCARCHGSYGRDWTYPNLVIALEEIGTDPELALAATRDERRFIEWYDRSFYGKRSRIAPAPGYIAPPLDGVWATAPYLHNGSVPTIEALLDSSKRPTYWLRSFSSKDYNEKALGWNYTEVSHGKDGAADAKLRKRLYDTTLPGYSNKGHAFGDALTAAERAALLEYLKTL